MIKKVIYQLLFLICVSAIVAVPVVATNYIMTFTVTETEGTSYNQTPVIVSINNDYLVEQGFISANATDTRVYGNLGERPHMVVDNKVIFSDSIPANSVSNIEYRTGYNSSVMHLLTGRGGNVTTADNASLELGNNFSLEWEGYVDTSAAGNKDLVYKEDAFRLYVPEAGYVRAAILGANDSETYSVNASVATGAHNIIASANVSYFSIYIDDSLEDAISITGELLFSDDETLDITSDGTYYYALTPDYIYKFTESDGEFTYVLSNDFYGFSTHPHGQHIYSYGNYLYVTYIDYYYYVFHIYQISPSDLSVYDSDFVELDDYYEDGAQLAYDGSYWLYAAVANDHDSEGKVLQIDSSNLSVNNTWTGNETEGFCENITYYGGYVYVARAGTPATVDKITAANMTTNDTYIGPNWNARALDNDGTYLYMGFLSTNGGAVSKIQMSDLSLIDTYEDAGNSGNGIEQVSVNGSYVYASGQYIQSWTKIYKIDTTLMTATTWTSSNTASLPDFAIGGDGEIVIVNPNYVDVEDGVVLEAIDSSDMSYLGILSPVEFYDVNGTTPDNANLYYWVRNNVSPYTDYIYLSVNGTEVLKYQPEDIIVSIDAYTGTLPDLDTADGQQDGTIYFGTNLTGNYTEIVPETLPETSPSNNVSSYISPVTDTPDEPKNMFDTCPKGDLIAAVPEAMLTGTGVPLSYFWFLFPLILALVIAFFIHDKTKSLFAQFIVMEVCLIMLWSFCVWPLWFTFVFAFYGLACVMAGKVYSY